MKFDIPFIVYDPADFVMPKGSAKFLGIVSAALQRAHLRTRCAEAQAWRCCYCHKPMSLENGSKRSITLEHIIPISKGGVDEYESCAAACKRCNNRRGNRELSEDMKTFLPDPKKEKEIDPLYTIRRKVKTALKEQRRCARKGTDFGKWLEYYTSKLKESDVELFHTMLAEAQGE